MLLPVCGRPRARRREVISVVGRSVTRPVGSRLPLDTSLLNNQSFPQERAHNMTNQRNKTFCNAVSNSGEESLNRIGPSFLFLTLRLLSLQGAQTPGSDSSSSVPLLLNIPHHLSLPQILLQLFRSHSVCVSGAWGLCIICIHSPAAGNTECGTNSPVSETQVLAGPEVDRGDGQF